MSNELPPKENKPGTQQHWAQRYVRQQRPSPSTLEFRDLIVDPCSAEDEVGSLFDQQ